MPHTRCSASKPSALLALAKIQTSQTARLASELSNPHALPSVQSTHAFTASDRSTSHLLRTEPPCQLVNGNF